MFLFFAIFFWHAFMFFRVIHLVLCRGGAGRAGGCVTVDYDLQDRAQRHTLPAMSRTAGRS